MSCIESCVFFRQSPYGCKQCTRCGICLPLYCHSMLQEHSPDVAFEYYVLVWKLNASLQLWQIKKQQLILIIKLVTSVFWFPCFNRKINQRVLFVFFRILYCKICVQFFNKPIHNFKPIKFATSNNVLHFYRVLGKNQTQRWRHSPYSHSRVVRFLIGK